MNGTTNTFLGGLVKDMHPLTLTQQTLSDAMNATLITFNGNELMLLNDMGNTKIQDSKTGNIMGLRDGFIPVGLHEHGGIMYIASVDNEGNGLIGTIPSPVIKYAKKNTGKTLLISLEFGDKESSAITISDRLLYPEDKFLIYVDDKSGSIGTIFKEYEVPVYVSGSVGIEYISYPYISKPFPTQDSEQGLEYKRGLYKLNLYAKTKNNTIKLNDSLNNLIVLYKDTIPNDYQNHLWFAYGSPDNVDEDKMILLDGINEIDYFLHYPSIAPGTLAISTEPETISSFSLAENFTNVTLDGIGLIYPITLEKLGISVPEYFIGILGFIYETHSAVHIDKISISIDLDTEEFFEIGNQTLYRGKISETKFIIGTKDTVDDYLNKKKLFTRLKYILNLETKYIRHKNIEDTLNKDLVLEVKYYCTDISDKKPLGIYTLNFNQYYFDTATPYLLKVFWEPHTYSNGNPSVFMARYPKEFLSKEIKVKDTLNDGASNAEVNGTNTNVIALGKKIKDDDYVSAKTKQFELPITVSLDTSIPTISSNYKPSSYLKIPLKVVNDTEGSITVTSVKVIISVITTLHNKGGWWNKCTDPGIKFNLKIFDQSDAWEIKGTKEAYNGKGRIYFNTDNYKSFGEGTSIVKAIQDSIDLKNKSLNIKLEFSDIRIKQVSNAFPDDIYGDLDADLSALIVISYLVNGQTAHFTYTNQSPLMCFPQYDLFGIKTDGFKSETIPVHISDDGFTEANVSTENLLNLSRIAREDDSNETALVFNGILNNLDATAYTISIPKKKKYLLAATKYFTLDKTTDITDKIIDGNITSSITVYGKAGKQGDNTIPNIGLYELLDLSINNEDSIIKQSCVTYTEGKYEKDELVSKKEDKWEERKFSNLGASSEYLKDVTEYSYKVDMSGGNMERYKDSNGSFLMEVPIKDGTVTVEFIENTQSSDYIQIVIPNGPNKDDIEIGGIVPGGDIKL